MKPKKTIIDAKSDSPFTAYLNSIQPEKEISLPAVGICIGCDWQSKEGMVSCRGMDIATQKEIFCLGPFSDGSSNIAAFIAIVHALAYCKLTETDKPVYADSRVAIGWVFDKLVLTTLEHSDRNDQLFAMADRAIKWLRENEYKNDILKWDSRSWGPSPASYEREYQGWVEGVRRHRPRC